MNQVFAEIPVCLKENVPISMLRVIIFAFSIIVLTDMQANAASERFLAAPIQWQRSGDTVQAARTVWPGEELSVVKTDLDGDGVAELLVRFDRSCVPSRISGNEPGEDLGCPYALLRWTGVSWDAVLERSAWTVAAYARNERTRPPSVAVLEIDGELLVIREGRIVVLQAQVEPYTRPSSDREIELAQAARGGVIRTEGSIVAETGVIDINDDGAAERIVILREADDMVDDDENPDLGPWPWVILDSDDRPIATGESFAMPGIMATPGGGRVVVVSTDQVVEILELYR